MLGRGLECAGYRPSAFGACGGLQSAIACAGRRPRKKKRKGKKKREAPAPSKLKWSDLACSSRRMERLWPERGVHVCRKDNHGADEVISCHIEALAWRESARIARRREFPTRSFLKMTRVSASRMPRCYRRPSPLIIGTGALAVNFDASYDASSDGMIDRMTAGTEVYRSPYPAKIPGHGPTGAFDSINQITKATPMSQAYRRPVMTLLLRRPPPRGNRQSLSTP